VFYTKFAGNKFAYWETGIYTAAVHHHVTNCREYLGLRIVRQFSLWSWGKNEENLQTHARTFKDVSPHGQAFKIPGNHKANINKFL